MNNDSADALPATGNEVPLNVEPPEHHWLIRVVRKRYAFGMYLLLSIWAFIGYEEDFGPLANGLLLDNYLQVALLTVANLMAVVFATAMLRLLNRRLPGTWLTPWIGDGTADWKAFLIFIASALALVTPAILVVSFASEIPEVVLPHWLASAFAIGIGLLAGWALMWGLGWLKCFLVGGSEEQSFFPFETPGGRAFLCDIGFFALIFEKIKSIGDWLSVENSDYQFLAYLSILGTIHWTVAQTFSSTEMWSMSAPCMVIILIWIVGMLLAGVANLFDKYSLPIVLPLILLITLLQIPFGPTRTINTVAEDSKLSFAARITKVTKAEEAFLNDPGSMARKETRQSVISKATTSLDDDAWKSVVRRMEELQPAEPAKGKTLVIITCPGGGIHAASWAACVMESISNEYADFADSIGVISAVSGGSVGTLHFVSKHYHNELTGDTSPWPPNELTQVISPPPQGLELASSLELASRSSLEAVAYGMISDDLYGMFFPPLCIRDRGQRLEDMLEMRLPESQRKLTMGHWGDLAVVGKLPIVIFNATDAATGRRIVFDTVPTPRRPSNVGKSTRPINYRELLPTEGNSLDVLPVTAARCSATFPYIAPFTKPDQASPAGNQIAIGDGGYADNEGIVSAVNWVEFLLTRWADIKEPLDRPFQRILILRLQPSDVDDSEQATSDADVMSWFRWAIGPIETIVNVRTSSQAERGNLETDLASLYLESGSGESDVLERAVASGVNTGLGEAKFDRWSSARFDKTAAEEAFRQHGKTDAANRADWKERIEKFKEQLKQNSTQAMQPPPYEQEVGDNRPQAIVGNANLPVVVQTISFQNFDQVIPLNWKLSREQKLWYLYSWKLAAEKDSSVRKTLDQFFTRSE